jgi:predicted nucleic acid-binding protein
MKALFIDTWGWLTLTDEREHRHDAVRALYATARREKVELVTTDYVLDETATLFFKRLLFAQAETAFTLLLRSAERGALTLERIAPARFEAACQLRLRYDDKPRISFTDFTSMVVMRERGLHDVLTGDAHFEHVGLGFQRRP